MDRLKLRTRTATFRFIWPLLRLVIVALLLVQATQLTLRTDPRDRLRAADADFGAGRYYHALQAYTQLAATYSAWPDAALRVGVVRELRGEHVLAVRALSNAIAAGLREPQRDLATLYLGHALLAAGETQRGEHVWQTIGPRSPYAPLMQILQGERALLAGDNDAAVGFYRAALIADSRYPIDDSRTRIQVRLSAINYRVSAIAAYRLALLRGATDGSAALTELAPPTLVRVDASESVDARLVQPLLPPVAPGIPTNGGADGQLAAILRAAPDERAQMLGQLYLELGLPQLARSQFERVGADSPLALSATIYAAYARLRAGDHQGGLAGLQAIVQKYPNDPRARMLLATAYVADNQFDQAEHQITTLQTQPGQQVQAQLAWASWHSAQHDYGGAMAAYQQMVADAPPEKRGMYALLVAQFHLNSGFEICTGGLDAADIAARELPNDADVQTVLAGSRLYCNDPGGAVLAARAALALSPRADAAYYLGAGLAAQGDTADARSALVRAADLAPASPWRERAEQVIAGL